MLTLIPCAISSRIAGEARLRCRHLDHEVLAIHLAPQPLAPPRWCPRCRRRGRARPRCSRSRRRRASHRTPDAARRRRGGCRRPCASRSARWRASPSGGAGWTRRNPSEWPIAFSKIEGFEVDATHPVALDEACELALVEQLAERKSSQTAWPWSTSALTGFMASLPASCALAARTTASVVNPNCGIRSLIGAERPEGAHRDDLTGRPA